MRVQSYLSTHVKFVQKMKLWNGETMISIFENTSLDKPSGNAKLVLNLIELIRTSLSFLLQRSIYDLKERIRSCKSTARTGLEGEKSKLLEDKHAHRELFPAEEILKIEGRILGPGKSC